jgi:hypothetical protein
MGTLWTLQSSQPGLSLYSKLPQAYGTSYYVISLSVNIILTILIMIRLFMYRRVILEALPEEHARHYVSIAAIIVESAALYSVLALVFIITYAVNNPLNQVFLASASAAQVRMPNYFMVGIHIKHSKSLVILSSIASLMAVLGPHIPWTRTRHCPQ